MTPLHLRPMTRTELAWAVDRAADEGWNPGLYDADCFHAADPQGFFVGEVDGEPASCISAVRYGERFGFLGFYIVVPEQRGRGYGIRTWERALEHLAGRCVGLDGVVEQEANYQRSGFHTAYRNVRYGGRPIGHRPPDVVDLRALPVEQVLAFDTAIFGAPREQFLRCWLRQPESAGAALQRDGQLVGYGVIRRCREGHKVGPLFAEDVGVAEELLQALAFAAAGELLFLDVPAVNTEAVDLAIRHSLEPVFETVRMYNAPAPLLPLQKVFGVTTFELG